jgi:hypothetical protein
VAELAWAFSYWPALPIVSGAAIWLGFYVLSGIVEHGATQSLDRRVTLEYSGVALIGAAVVVVFTLVSA